MEKSVLSCSSSSSKWSFRSICSVRKLTESFRVLGVPIFGVFLRRFSSGGSWEILKIFSSARIAAARRVRDEFWALLLTKVGNFLAVCWGEEIGEPTELFVGNLFRKALIGFLFGVWRKRKKFDFRFSEISSNRTASPLFNWRGVLPRAVSIVLWILIFDLLEFGSFVRETISSVDIEFRSIVGPVWICGGERMLFHLFSFDGFFVGQPTSIVDHSERHLTFDSSPIIIGFNQAEDLSRISMGWSSTIVKNFSQASVQNVNSVYLSEFDRLLKIYRILSYGEIQGEICQKCFRCSTSFRQKLKDLNEWNEWTQLSSIRTAQAKRVLSENEILMKFVKVHLLGDEKRRVKWMPSRILFLVRVSYFQESFGRSSVDFCRFRLSWKQAKR